MVKRPAASRSKSSIGPFAPRPAPVIETFAVDERVTHDKYGLGRVVSLTESAVVVRFGTQNVLIPSPYSRMTKL